MLRAVATVIIVLLLALTGVRVGALWTKQQGVVGAPQGPAPADRGMAARSLNAFVPQQKDSVLARLNDRLATEPDDFEASLLKGLVLFREGNLNAAIAVLRGLAQRAPNFQLAHLVLGDLLAARFAPLDSIGRQAVREKAGPEAQRLVQLRAEARARLLGYLSAVDGSRVPKALTVLSENVVHALAVDKSKNRLYVYRNSGPGRPPELVDDFYIVLGKEPGNKMREGDLKTPNGVYFVTSYLPDEKLSPLYGSGAFPVNYPNEFDRRQNKTGSGIWLHGTDKSLYSRPPLDSEGCVVLTNDEFARIAEYVEVGRTPVVIGETLEWVSGREWLDRNIELQAALERWRSSWESADLDSYLGLYSRDFWARGHDRSSWALYKKQVFMGKKQQRIDLSDLSLFEYPVDGGDRPMVVANFVQHYRSNNFTGDMRKRLYLIEEDGRWKVLYEGGQ